MLARTPTWSLQLASALLLVCTQQQLLAGLAPTWDRVETAVVQVETVVSQAIDAQRVVEIACRATAEQRQAHSRDKRGISLSAPWLARCRSVMLHC